MGNVVGQDCSQKCTSYAPRCLGKEFDARKDGELVEVKSVGSPGIDSWDKLNTRGPSDVPPRGSPLTGEETGGLQETNLTYKDGSTYEGQFLSGKRHGRGVWKSSTGQYDGQWKTDQQDGQGQQRWQDGRVYIGQFSRGKFDGHGRMEWHTPQGLMIFEGDYVNDQKHGTGKFIWPDGRMYDGEWAKGKRWGKGTYHNSRGEKKEGLWVNDKLDRWLDGDQKN
mmetsp:Transcript_66175/g.117686  ORF Transcript_66175/g.117686 Transcript_66175/m.117686 type:complete len:223 (+) Transcript_66175:105-773(+)